MTEKFLAKAIKTMVPALFLIALVSLAGCAGSQATATSLRLPQGLTIGQITGPGSEELTRVLKSRTTGGSPHGILNGTVSFNEHVRQERETVPVTVESGPEQTVYKPDPFTNRLWKVNEKPTSTQLQTFDYQRLQGTMVFDWRVTAPGGAVLETGRSVVDLNRTFGGFLANEQVAPGRKNAVDLAADARRILAEEMTQALALDLGREPSSFEIETANDEWSRRAKSLATAGDWEGARHVWLEALELNPGFSPALYNLGLYYERQKNPEQAWRYYRDAFVSEASDLHRTALTRVTEALKRAGRLPAE